MKGIVWLASYPKSGNTWFRTFLTNFLRNADAPANINALDVGQIASARAPFDEAVGYDSGELTPDEIDALRPEVYLHQAREAEETLYWKVHDAYTFLPDGRALIPAEATACALYFLRNPLDVAVSFAHHSGHDRFDRVVRQMGREQMCFCATDATETNQLRQKLLTWSGHVRSWVDAPRLRVHVLRYEDMKARPEETFGAAVRFLELPDDPARVKKALEFSRFEELQRQEGAGGFREKMRQARSFFRKGEVGGWRSVLTPEQVKQLLADHADVMRRFGYLDARGEPVY
ncbi:MAG TPA: sulfotransferase domain-containing protein [Acidobacteriota bacterium]|nr:sulfotransferase domain-containing protein [Acidobacteriota bacterium]